MLIHESPVIGCILLLVVCSGCQTVELWQDASGKTALFDGLDAGLQGSGEERSLQVKYVYYPLGNHFPREMSTLRIPLNKDGTPAAPYFMGTGSFGVKSAVGRAAELNLIPIGGADPTYLMGLYSSDAREQDDRVAVRQLPQGPGEGPGFGELVILAYRRSSNDTIEIAGYNRYNRPVGLRAESTVILVPAVRDRPIGDRLRTQAIAALSTPLTLAEDAVLFPLQILLSAPNGFRKID